MSKIVTVDMDKVRDWLFSRAEMHQDRAEWEASFEDLYLVTAINRGDFVSSEESDAPPKRSPSWIESTKVYSIYRRLFSCRAELHRFVEVVDSDPTALIPGYYCIDCMRFVPESRISQFRATCEIYDDNCG